MISNIPNLRKGKKKKLLSKKTNFIDRPSLWQILWAETKTFLILHFMWCRRPLNYHQCAILKDGYSCHFRIWRRHKTQMELSWKEKKCPLRRSCASSAVQNIMKRFLTYGGTSTQRDNCGQNIKKIWAFVCAERERGHGGCSNKHR